MKIVRTIAAILLIVGGLNWGLVGLFGFDLVAFIFGAGEAITRIIYILVGLSAACKAICFYKKCTCHDSCSCERK